MNRRQKIIVSITGIFIVLLALVGLTYAYFLTRITGNENDKSISVTTADLRLVYNDGTDGILTNTDPIIPGKFESSKTFSVTNTGTKKVDNYAVVLENYSVVYANDVGQTIKEGDLTSLDYPEDWKINITCKSYINYGQSNQTESGTCDGVSEGILPTNDDILIMNSIDQGITQVYTLTLRYDDSGENQSNDMNKRIEGKINIINTNETIDLAGTVDSTSVAYVEVSENTSVSQTSDKTEGTVKRLGEIDGTETLKELAFETKRTYVTNKKYKMVGIPLGNYNIKMYNSSNVQVGSTQTIEIVKGTESGISGNTITITDKSRIVSMSLTSNDITLENIENLPALSPTFTKGNSISLLTNKIVEDVDIKTEALSIPFSVKNNSDEHQNLTIKLTDIVMDSALKNIDFRWGLYNADTEVGLAFGIFKYTTTEELIYTDTILDAGSAAKNYILRIWVHNNGTAQTELLNKSFKGNINVTSEAVEYTPESCFTFNNGSITGYNPECGENIVVPKKINNTEVTDIGRCAFSSGGPTCYRDDWYTVDSVIIPEGIKTIGEGALESLGVNEKTLTIPEGVITISASALNMNKIVFLSLPETISSVGHKSFGGISSMKSIVLPGTIKNIYGELFFDGGYGGSGTIEEIILMDGIEEITYWAFYGSGVASLGSASSIEIPKSVKKITYQALNGGASNYIIRGKNSITDFEDYTGLTTENDSLFSDITLTFRD